LFTDRTPDFGNKPHIAMVDDYFQETGINSGNRAAHVDAACFPTEQVPLKFEH
jgi:hypothetical protein